MLSFSPQRAWSAATPRPQDDFVVTLAQAQLPFGADAESSAFLLRRFCWREAAKSQRVHGTRQHRDETTGKGEEEASLKLHLEINCMRPADFRL